MDVPGIMGDYKNKNGSRKILLPLFCREEATRTPDLLVPNEVR